MGKRSNIEIFPFSCLSSSTVVFLRWFFYGGVEKCVLLFSYSYSFKFPPISLHRDRQKTENRKQKTAQRRRGEAWRSYLDPGPVPTLPTPPTLPTRTITFLHYGCRVRETERSERCTSFGARTSATRHGRPRARWTNTNTTTTSKALETTDKP